MGARSTRAVGGAGNDIRLHIEIALAAAACQFRIDRHDDGQFPGGVFLDTGDKVALVMLLDPVGGEGSAQ